MNKQSIVSLVKQVSFWLMFVFIGLLLLFILMEAFLPKQTINVFQVRSYIASYDTMEPTIKPNDLVFINKVNPSKLVPGDLVTFTADINYDGDTEMVTYYVHSITDLGDGRYRIGVIAEGSMVPFGTILSDRIVGGYAFRIPVLGSIVKFVKSPFGIAAVVINTLVVVGIVVIVKQGKPKEKIETSAEHDKA